MTALPLSDDTVGAVVACYSLSHIPFEAHQTVIKQFSCVLRLGGRVLVSKDDTDWNNSNQHWLEDDVEMQWSVAGADATRSHPRMVGLMTTEEWEL